MISWLLKIQQFLFFCFVCLRKKKNKIRVFYFMSICPLPPPVLFNFIHHNCLPSEKHSKPICFLFCLYIYLFFFFCKQYEEPTDLTTPHCPCPCTWHIAVKIQHVWHWCSLLTSILATKEEHFFISFFEWESGTSGGISDVNTHTHGCI